MTVRHNAERHRYEIVEDDTVEGLADYREDGGTLVFFHTEVEPSRQGKGIGTELVAGALEDVRSRGLRVRPLCWFVRDYIYAHPEIQDVLAA